MSNDRFPPTPLSDDMAKKITEQYDPWLAQHDKRIRAEVLAAVLSHLRRDIRWQKNECGVAGEQSAWIDGYEKALYEAAKEIEQLQPSTLDLLSLLQEAEVEGIRWAEGRDIAQITARLTELETAHAEGKG